MSTKTSLERFADSYLEDDDVESLLEYLDISIYEALECLYENGLIDIDIVTEYLADDDGAQGRLF